MERGTIVVIAPTEKFIKKIALRRDQIKDAGQSYRNVTNTFVAHAPIGSIAIVIAVNRYISSFVRFSSGIDLLVVSAFGIGWIMKENVKRC